MCLVKDGLLYSAILYSGCKAMATVLNEGQCCRCRIGIVIVNYRTADLAIDCLRSISYDINNIPSACVTLIDGGSEDGSAQQIAQAISSEGWGEWVDLLPLDTNRGFAAGNNAALRPLLATPNPPDYVLLLNPDTVVRPGAVRVLIEFMDANPKVGIAGSRLEDPDGTPQRSAFRFPTVAGEFESSVRLGLVSRLLSGSAIAPPVRDEAHPTDWVAGASMIVRWSTLVTIGLLDEGYFLYYEETDFCLRARRSGWQCWYVPASRVVHLVGQSSGVTNPNNRPKRMPRYWFESRARYFRKNHGVLYAFMASAAWLLGFAAWRVRAWLQRKPDTTPAYFVQDFVRYTLFTPDSGRRIA